jgi:hypothetical protein
MIEITHKNENSTFLWLRNVKEQRKFVEMACGVEDKNGAEDVG